MFKQKRAELTTQQIVLLIILITSFAVILILFFRLDLGGEETQKEICHNSVVLKGKGTLAKLAAGGGSLDCRTNYVCISGGGKCEGINPTETKKINLIDSEKPEDIKKNKEAIMEVIADEMADCWWMFGEGKIDYGGSWDSKLETIVPWSKYNCAVCSDLKFDKIIQDKIQEINYNEFYIFLNSNKKDDSQTYLKYLYDSNSFDVVKSKLEVKDKDFKFSKSFLTKERFVIITGMKKGGYIHPYFIESNKITTKTECGIFDITKAS